jgi:hypothetical protein
MSEFICVLPLSDGDARRTTLVYPGLGKEGPTSSGGRVYIILHRSACIRVNTSRGECEVLSPQGLAICG